METCVDEDGGLGKAGNTYLQEVSLFIPSSCSSTQVLRNTQFLDHTTSIIAKVPKALKRDMVRAMRSALDSLGDQLSGDGDDEQPTRQPARPRAEVWSARDGGQSSHLPPHPAEGDDDDGDDDADEGDHSDGNEDSGDDEGGRVDEGGHADGNEASGDEEDVEEGGRVDEGDHADGNEDSRDDEDMEDGKSENVGRTLEGFEIAFGIDNEHCTRAALADLARAAFAKLDGIQYSIVKSQRRETRVLSTKEAEAVTRMFFEDMVGGLMTRLQKLVENVARYNAMCESGVAAVSSDAPAPIRRLWMGLSTLYSSDIAIEISTLRRNIGLVGLSQEWDTIREAVQEVHHISEASQAIQTFLCVRGGSGRRGLNMVSKAKAALCSNANISTQDFEKYIRDSQLPVALVKHFGRGSLMLCPTTQRQ